MLECTNIKNVYKRTSNLMNDSNSLDSVLNYISNTNCIIYYELLNVPILIILTSCLYCIRACSLCLEDIIISRGLICGLILAQ